MVLAICIVFCLFVYSHVVVWPVLLTVYERASLGVTWRMTKDMYYWSTEQLGLIGNTELCYRFSGMDI